MTDFHYCSIRKCGCPLNGHELACLEDREYIRIHTKILTGYELTDRELTDMINKIKSQHETI
jgi:hypothetical protein